jgi:hypothetical protein
MDPLIREVLKGWRLSEEELDKQENEIKNKAEQKTQITSRKAFIKSRKKEIRNELLNTTSVIKRSKLNSELTKLIFEEKDLYAKHEEN